MDQQDPEPARDQDQKDDHLADGGPLAAAGRRPHEAPGIEGDRRQRVEQYGEAGTEPRRRRAAGGEDHLLEDRHQKDRKTEGVENRRHDRGEPHDPADGERRLDRQHLAGVGVGPTGLRKAGGELGKRQRREDGDGAVEGEGDDGARTGGRKGDPGEGEHAAADDRADADQGRAAEAEASLVVGAQVGHEPFWHQLPPTARRGGRMETIGIDETAAPV